MIDDKQKVNLRLTWRPLRLPFKSFKLFKTINPSPSSSPASRGRK